MVEDCCIPFHWKEDFSEEYLNEIRYYCLIMSQGYIEQHFPDIKEHADEIEQRMEDCLTKENTVPQWYMAMEGTRIIGGLGVIENDFHDRKDLAPNVCAVYTETDKRCNGVAGALLNYVCADMKKRGIEILYLVTDHSSFYERYGWEFLCMVQGDGEPDMTRMYIHRG